MEETSTQHSWHIQTYKSYSLYIHKHKCTPVTHMIANSHAIYPPASLFHTVHIILQLAVCNPKNLQCVTQWSNKQNLNFNTPHTECKKKTHLPNPKARSTLPKFFVGCFRAATSQLCTHCTLTSAHWSLTTSRFRAEPRTCREGWWHEKKRSLRCWIKKTEIQLMCMCDDMTDVWKFQCIAFVWTWICFIFCHANCYILLVLWQRVLLTFCKNPAAVDVTIFQQPKCLKHPNYLRVMIWGKAMFLWAFQGRNKSWSWMMRNKKAVTI